MRLGRQAAAVDDRDPYGQLALGLAYGFSGEDEKALTSFTNVVEDHPNFALGHLFMALLWRESDPEAAVAFGRASARAEPSQSLSPHHFRDLGRSSPHRGEARACARIRPDGDRGASAARPGAQHHGRESGRPGPPPRSPGRHGRSAAPPTRDDRADGVSWSRCGALHRSPARRRTPARIAQPSSHSAARYLHIVPRDRRPL